jgi:hypothetical protein
MWNNLSVDVVVLSEGPALFAVETSIYYSTASL